MTAVVLAFRRPMAQQKECRDTEHEGERLLPVTSFYLSKQAKDGRQPRCKACDKRKAAKRSEHSSGYRATYQRSPAPEVLEETEAEPEDDWTPRDREATFRELVSRAYGRGLGDSYQRPRGGKLPERLDELAIARWVNIAFATLCEPGPAGARLDRALALANEDEDLEHGDEDPPVGGPLAKVITLRPELVSAPAPREVARSTSWADHTARTALAGGDRVGIGEDDDELEPVAVDHYDPFGDRAAKKRLAKALPVSPTVKPQQCRGCMHDAHPGAQCSYGIGSLFGQCSCLRSRARRTPGSRLELQARVEARGHGPATAPDPFDCMPLGLELLRRDREEREASERSAERARKWEAAGGLEASLLATLRERGPKQVYDLTGPDDDDDQIHAALVALLERGLVERFKRGRVEVWRVKP